MGLRTVEAQRRTRLLHHRIDDNGPRLPRPLQCAQRWRGDQPAGRRHRRSARLRGPQRAVDPGRRRLAPRLCGHLQQLHPGAAHGDASSRHRGRRTAEAGDPARSARWRRVQSTRGLANGRRDARRPGRVAAPVRSRDRIRAPATARQRAFVAAAIRWGPCAYKTAFVEELQAAPTMRYVIYGPAESRDNRSPSPPSRIRCLPDRAGGHFGAIQRHGLRFVSPTEDCSWTSPAPIIPATPKSPRTMP